MKGFPSRAEVERIKAQYPKGTMICCDNMPDDPQPIPPGTIGEISGVDDAGQLLVKWINGRSLSLIPGVDSFHIIPHFHDLQSMSEDELYEKDTLKFESFEELFDYIYDENTSKEDIINDMSEKMKKELITNNYSDRIITDGKTFYYNSDDFSDFDIQQHDKSTFDAESFQTENGKEEFDSGKLIDRERCRYGDVYVTTCYDEGIESWDDDNIKHVCEGYFCQVYSDPEFDYEIDNFCLAVGFEIDDISDASVEAGILNYLGLSNEELSQNETPDEDESQGISIDL